MSKRKRIAELERRVKELEDREAQRPIVSAPVYVPYYVPSTAAPPSYPVYPFESPFYVTCGTVGTWDGPLITSGTITVKS